MTGYTPDQRKAALAELARLYRVVDARQREAWEAVRDLAAHRRDPWHLARERPADMEEAALVPGLKKALALIVERERELQAEEHAHENPDAGSPRA